MIFIGQNNLNNHSNNNAMDGCHAPCHGWMDGFYQFNHAKPMPSFANFKNLRTLRVASPFLFGSISLQQGDGGTDLLAPLLPDGLDTLHITRCDHALDFIYKQLEFLLERLANTTHLSKIIIEDPSLGAFPQGSYYHTFNRFG